MIISVLVGLYFVLMGTVLIRRGAVNWRREVSFAPRLRSLPFTDAAKAGMERAFLTGGSLHYLLAALMGVAAYLQTTGLAAAAARPAGAGGPAGATARPPLAVGTLALVILVGAAGSGCLLLVITVFKRPRFLASTPSGEPQGGGWGHPFDREADQVRRDVLSGFVSRESARADYGVIMDPDTFELDLSATKEASAPSARTSCSTAASTSTRSGDETSGRISGRQPDSTVEERSRCGCRSR